jgi:hypothetical protein
VRSSRAAIGVALVVLPQLASAHPINTALSVVSEDAIRIGHGLVTLDEMGRWRFVCPAAWGGPETPLSLGLGPDTMVVIAGDGAFEMTLDGIAALLEERIVASRTRELERAGGVVLALASDVRGSIVAAFEAGSARVILEETRRLHSIEGTEDGFVATSSAAEGVRLTTYGLDGSEVGSSIVPYGEIATATAGIERAGGELYALLAHPGEYRLARIDGDRLRLIATSELPILGPVRAGEEVWFIEDGALLRATGTDVEVIDQTQLYSCLEEGDGFIYACIDTRIYALRPNADPELLFDLLDVKGPRLSHFDPDDRVSCEFEWAIFASEAGLDPTIPDDGEEEPAPSCGCTATPRGGAGSVLLLFLVCLRAWRQRARRMVRLPSR